MKVSLRSKLSLTYVLIAFVCISLLSLLTNFFLEKQFKEYVEQNQEQKNKSVVSSLAKQYEYSGSWNQITIENVGVSALENGMIIKVKDASGTILWDATAHNNGMCQKILEKMADNMNSHYHNVKGAYVEKPYPIIASNNNQVGTVLVGYYGPFYLSDNDLLFISTLNKALVGVGGFLLILSLILGGIMAKRISTPISEVINTAKMISKGLYRGRITIRTNTKEIYELSETVNNLAHNLELQETLRKRLTGDVAHELRTPLATLQSHLEAMLDGIWKPDNERLNSCHEEVLRINRMIGDIEKLAKYESENLVIDKSIFNASEVIRRLFHNFESDFKNKNVSFEFTSSDATIYADKDKFSQVMINLIANALKYTLSGGKVLIELKENDEETLVLVKDNGVGISEEDLPFIFERFYRADKSRNRMAGGSGIGLTIAKAIVSAHGGRIEIKSSLNVGTEVVISIPKGGADNESKSKD